MKKIYFAPTTELKKISFRNPLLAASPNMKVVDKYADESDGLARENFYDYSVKSVWDD